MKVFYGLDKFAPVPHAVVTSGTFDGVHLGHQRIISRMREIAQSVNGETVIITLWPHPKYVLGSSNGEPSKLKLLSSIDEKIELLRKYEIDNLVILPFTKEFAATTSMEFIQHIIIEKLQTHNLVIGYDHRFGRNREGSFHYLVENEELFNFSIEEIPAHEVDNLTISSTKIRKALHDGKIRDANRLLGHPYALNGKVVMGQQVGRTIGFPTANIQIIEKNKLIPTNGVYAVRVRANDEHYGGMLNIGMRPTVNGKERSIEVHLFDFHEEIYGQFIQVELMQQIRTEKKFKNLEALAAQLELDKEASLQILSTYENIGN